VRPRRGRRGRGGSIGMSEERRKHLRADACASLTG
jgi:hypothetical protein